MRILCGGPVSEDPEIFQDHVNSLLLQLDQSIILDYKGIDNSPTELQKPAGFNFVHWRRELGMGEYKQNLVRWNWRRVRYVGRLREEMRNAAISGNYDYLFMVDSDVILGKNVLNKLLEAKKDIIDGLYWAKYKAERRHSWPNVWAMEKNRHVPPSGELLEKIKSGGVHEVQVSGACTLISKFALPKISYSVPLNMVSEDVCMAVSAQKAGIQKFIHCDVDIVTKRIRR